MLKIAFLFPGQGSQHAGMAKDFYDTSSKIRDLFKKANEIIGFSISDIMFNGPDSELQKTLITQPAVYLASQAALIRYKEEGGPESQWAAGHSLGEYSAFASAEAFTTEEGLQHVIKRGQLIQEAAQKNPGTMAAIIGLERSKVLELCQEVNRSEEVCEAVNFNTSAQIVIAGTSAGIEKAGSLAKERGAAKVVKLNVSGPFHSSLLRGAAQAMGDYLSKVSLAPAKIPVITNCDAQTTRQAAEIKEKLTRQIDHPVLWEDSILRLTSEGVTHFIELGPGRVLTGMIKRLAPQATALHVEDHPSLAKTLESLKAGRENEIKR